MAIQYLYVTVVGTTVVTLPTLNHEHIGVGLVCVCGGGGGGSSLEYSGGGKLFAGCKLIGAPAPNQGQIITSLTKN